MKTMTMRYPGDPPMTVTEMTRAEFSALFRPSEFRIENMDTGESTSFPIGPDDIRCDLCNSDPGDTVVVLSTEAGHVLKGHCLGCAREGWYPYCEETKGVQP